MEWMIINHIYTGTIIIYVYVCIYIYIRLTLAQMLTLGTLL